MRTSQNGYTVLEDISDCKNYPINNRTFVSLPLRPGPVGYVLAWYAKAFDLRIEPLNRTDCFGYDKRPIANSNPFEWSNHASGTAVDTNASKHPQGHVGTFTIPQVEELRNIFDDLDGVVKWGGDYHDLKDEMHAEIIGTEDEVNLVAKRLKRKNTVSLGRLHPGDRNIDVYMVKRVLRKRGFDPGPMNLYYSAALAKAYDHWAKSVDVRTTPNKKGLELLGFKVTA